MAYNSDGYIMIDFTEVDFRRTNQTIEGLYKRCVDVIGTNKFILVINANGRTPLPATCSFTNNQYVIDTVIYMFAVSSNDNLFIRRNDVPASDIINDDIISVDNTWSSDKIDTELDGKQDTLTPVSPVSINADNEISVDLSGKQDTLTPVSPVSINADNEISVDLSSKQNVLTAGDNIEIVDNVISAKCIKKHTYIGTGTNPNVITFPDTPEYIFSIEGPTTEYNWMTSTPIVFGKSITVSSTANTQISTAVWYAKTLTYSGNSMSITGGSPEGAFNHLDYEYTVYYI